MSVIKLAIAIRKEKERSGGKYWYGLARIRLAIDSMLSELEHGGFGFTRKDDSLYMGGNLALSLEIEKQELKTPYVYIRRYDPSNPKDAESFECKSHAIAPFDSRGNFSEQLNTLEEMVANLVSDLLFRQTPCNQ